MKLPTKVMEHTDDAQLAERIRDALDRRNVRNLRHVEVQVQDRNVTVTGKVNSFYEKQLATSCCQRVAGVHRVINELVVTDY